MSVSFVNPHAATAVASSTYDYDRNGNLAAANGWKYNWDYNNRLTDALLGTTTKVRYGYDPEGERTYYTNGADTTVYANKYFNTETHVKTVTTPITQCSPGYRPAAWRRPGIGSCVTYNQTKTVTTNKTTKQIYLGDLLLATVETENGKDSIYYVHTDHLTGSNIITDAQGKLAQTLDYYPFGGIRLNERSGNIDNKRKAFGHEYDSDSELYYMVARYQNPAVGRFISQDKAFLSVGNKDELKKITWMDLSSYLSNPQALNSYSYAYNNPLIYRDDDGNNPIVALTGIALMYVPQMMNYLQQLTTPVGQWFTNSFIDDTKTISSPASSRSEKALAGVNIGLAALPVAKGVSGSIKVANGLKLGQDFGKLGKVVESVAGKINSFDPHALIRMEQRNVDKALMERVVSNPLVTLKQAGDRMLYLTRDAAVVLDKAGKAITTYTKNEFKPHIINILKSIKK